MNNLKRSPEDLADDLVSTVGLKRARQLIDDTVRNENIWFSASPFDARRRLDIDVQGIIIATLCDGAMLRAMSLVCKSWKMAILQTLGKLRSVLVAQPAIPSCPFILIGCKGLIVPPVANGKFGENDQRRPIITRRNGSLTILALKAAKLSLFYDLWNYRQEDTCHRFDRVTLRFPRVSETKITHLRLRICLVNGQSGMAMYPVRRIQSGTVAEVRQKIDGTFANGGKPAGFCPECGKSRRKFGKCTICGKEGVTIEKAYKNWKDWK